jgi:hypothetical protein
VRAAVHWGQYQVAKLGIEIPVYSVARVGCGVIDHSGEASAKCCAGCQHQHETRDTSKNPQTRNKASWNRTRAIAKNLSRDLVVALSRTRVAVAGAVAWLVLGMHLSACDGTRALWGSGGVCAGARELYPHFLSADVEMQSRAHSNSNSPAAMATGEAMGMKLQGVGGGGTGEPIKL